MKIIVLIIGSLLAPSVIAKEAGMCSYYYEAVKRKAGNIEREDLSSFAKQTLFDTVRRDIKECLKGCEGYKFDYCNAVAKKIEEK